MSLHWNESPSNYVEEVNVAVGGSILFSLYSRQLKMIKPVWKPNRFSTEWQKKDETCSVLENTLEIRMLIVSLLFLNNT